MKYFLIILFVLLNVSGFSQELPTEPANGFSFPIGSKFTIKLYPKDSANFDYSIIRFEPFHEVVNMWDNDKLFQETGDEESIEFYFCLGTRGETDEEREENMKVLLLMKNYTKYRLSYQSDILISEDGEFQETSNVGSFPGAKGTEIWPYMIYEIGLHDFKIMNFNP